MSELAEIYGSEALPLGVTVGPHGVTFRLQDGEGGVSDACELSSALRVLARLGNRRCAQTSGRGVSVARLIEALDMIDCAIDIFDEAERARPRREPVDVVLERVKAEREAKRREVAGEIDPEEEAHGEENAFGHGEDGDQAHYEEGGTALGDGGALGHGEDGARAHRRAEGAAHRGAPAADAAVPGGVRAGALDPERDHREDQPRRADGDLDGDRD